MTYSCRLSFDLNQLAAADTLLSGMPLTEMRRSWAFTPYAAASDPSGGSSTTSSELRPPLGGVIVRTFSSFDRNDCASPWMRAMSSVPMTHLPGESCTDLTGASGRSLSGSSRGATANWSKGRPLPPVPSCGVSVTSPSPQWKVTSCVLIDVTLPLYGGPSHGALSGSPSDRCSPRSLPAPVCCLLYTS